MENIYEQKKSKSKKVMSYSFWGTIIFLAVSSIFLTLLSKPDSPSKHDIELTKKQISILTDTSSEVSKRTVQQIRIDGVIKQVIDEIYKPVYDGIPEYADFHYSILGEYTELTQVAVLKINEEYQTAFERRLFKDYEVRSKKEITQLNEAFIIKYIQLLEEVIQKNVEQSGVDPIFLSSIKTILDKAIKRAKISKPVAVATVASTSSAALKKAGLAFTKKFTGKLVAKAGGKAVGKGIGVIAGAGTGAAACFWAGPLAAVCGVAGAGIAWFTVDGIIINVDEYFNREEFECELKLFVDDHKKGLELIINQELRATAEKLDLEFKESIDTYRLNEL